MKLYENIKNRRLELKMTQTELAEKTGYTDKSSIAKIEKGGVDIPISKINEFAKALNTTPGELMGMPDQTASSVFLIENYPSKKKSHSVRIPVLGDVAAGIPIEAIEDIIDYEDIPEEIAASGEYFGLRIKGDSMEPRICEDDVVIVRKQEDADSGDIVIACVNGDSATCKKLYKYDNYITLVSLNNNYQPMIFTNEQIKETPITIIGKVVELRGKF